MTTGQALQKLTDVIRRKTSCSGTEQSYRMELRRYSDYSKGLTSHRSSEQKLERFLTALAQDNVASSTQNQAFNAIIFFYKEAMGSELNPKTEIRTADFTDDK